MRRSSGRPRATAVASVAAAVLLAALSSPVAAREPGPIVVVGGGDDPAILVEQSVDDLAMTAWKVSQAERLRAAVEGALKHPGRGPVGGPDPALVPPSCESDCPPGTFALDSWARQQITYYNCGPASGQVIINQTRDVVSSSTDGQSTRTNYRAQSVIAASMGTDSSTGTSSGELRNGLNQFADLDDSGRHVTFTILDVESGSDFHWAMVTATWMLRRGAAVPVQMTLSSQHLASWTSSSWWNSHPGNVVRHWISVRGYSGFWDGSYGPTLAYTDSAGGYGGQTGNFVSASRLLYNLNQANSGRIVY